MKRNTVLPAIFAAMVAILFNISGGYSASRIDVPSLQASSTAPEAVAALPEIETVEPAAPSRVPETPKEIFETPTASAEESMPDGNLPARLIIPSIGLDVPIEYVGINEKGEMAVPDGKTNNVGWYQYGTIPGETGSAVLAAHVYAAFSKLDRVTAGNDIYIQTKNGLRLRFRAADTTTYLLENVSGDALFNQNDAKRLNLITCAGNYVPERNTYDHRLIVRAVLVE